MDNNTYEKANKIKQRIIELEYETERLSASQEKNGVEFKKEASSILTLYPSFEDDLRKLVKKYLLEKTKELQILYKQFNDL